MKTKALVILLILSIGSVLLVAESGITASFKTGFPLNGTSIGLKLGPLNPYCGIDIARISGEYESSYASWDKNYTTGDVYKDYERNSTFDGSAMLFVPHAGLKFYLWKAYLVGEVMLCLPSISGKEEGKRIYYDSNGEVDEIDEWEDKLSKDEKDMIKDGLDFSGIKLGFGAEHFLNDHVSIGGEFGIRMILNTVSDKGDTKDDDGYYEYREKWNEELTAMLGVTYTSFSLNFIL